MESGFMNILDKTVHFVFHVCFTFNADFGDTMSTSVLETQSNSRLFHLCHSTGATAMYSFAKVVLTYT